MVEKLHIGGVDPDKEHCIRCGSWFLDTGWECNDCGYDNMPHYGDRAKVLSDSLNGNADAP